MRERGVDDHGDFHEVFHLHILWRMVATVVLSLLASMAAAAAVVAMYAIYAGDTRLHPLQVVSLLAFWLWAMVLCVYSMVGFWGSRIEVSERGIRFYNCLARPLDRLSKILFSDRLVLWDDILSVRRERGGRARILLSDGAMVTVSHIEGLERFTQLLKAALSDLHHKCREDEREGSENR